MAAMLLRSGGAMQPPRALPVTCAIIRTMLTLRVGSLEADVVPECGMVVASLRAGGRELLGLRGGLDAYREKGSTFGVPLLYPFANRLSEVRSDRIDASAARRDPAGLPIHGLPAARGAWEVLERAPGRVRAALRWDDPAFAPPHRIEVTHELRDGALAVTTTVAGDGVPVAFGWHPYLALDRAGTTVDIPPMRRHVLDDRGLPTGATEDAPAFSGPLGDRTYDDLFETPPDAVFAAGDVRVRFGEGARFTQVFAPAAEPLIAFEPMAAPTNALVSGDDLAVSPYTLRFEIALA
jgi:galactose mutarotase-like enzyme